MKDFVDILADSFSDDKEKKEVMHLVELLYFNDVRNSSFYWQRPWTKSEAFKIATDVVLLENSVEINSSIKGKDKELISDRIRNEFGLLDKKHEKRAAKYFQQETLMLEQISEIKLQYLANYKRYVTAIMITELIHDEKIRTRNSKIISVVITISLTIITTVITVYGAFLLKTAASNSQKDEKNVNSVSIPVSDKKLEENTNSATQQSPSN